MSVVLKTLYQSKNHLFSLFENEAAYVISQKVLLIENINS